MKRVLHSDLTLGEPLPFSIHDADGRLLLRKGVVLTIPGQIDKLVARGVLMGNEKSGGNASSSRNSPNPPVVNQSVYDQMDAVALNLKHIFTTALKAPEQIDLPDRIKKNATTIQSLCQEDLDSALAAPYLDFHNPYIIVHQLMGAILTEVIGVRKGLTAEERLPYVCAALTRDIGQLPIQSELDKCGGPLPPHLKEAMLGHTVRGVEILSRAGVNDQAWLHSVRQHHERFDGSGYPLKLGGEGITWGGGVLAITDTYSAMTKPRPYRDNKAHFPQHALRDMYMGKDSSLDGELVQVLIKEIGMLPPGSIVRLKNGEIAAVKNRTIKMSEAVVYSVYDQKGMPLVSPLRRETQSPEFEITGMVAFEECRSAAVTIKRLWVK
ncbi:MAG TPA: HD domain-containing phosphohydrolase [Sulfuricella sp.]|nr:HD domain-containing phosphohydrolase [Sulfuricella sp.]